MVAVRKDREDGNPTLIPLPLLSSLVAVRKDREDGNPLSYGQVSLSHAVAVRKDREDGNPHLVPDLLQADCRGPQGPRGLKFCRRFLIPQGLESRSARTARIEIFPVTPPRAPPGSRSARTARIEIPPASVGRCDRRSRSARTARIEISPGGHAHALTTGRGPQGPRGLKWDLPVEDVHPNPGRGPQGPRGLKSVLLQKGAVLFPVAVRKDREDGNLSRRRPPAPGQVAVRKDREDGNIVAVGRLGPVLRRGPQGPRGLKSIRRKGPNRRYTVAVRKDREDGNCACGGCNGNI